MPVGLKPNLLIGVHAQHAHCGAANGCLPDDVDAVPGGVIHPPMTPRVEQLGDLICFRINTR
jgi:hypothetical protein